MKYRAFLSYSRADSRVANWLHRKLDRYRTPRSLMKLSGQAETVAAQLHPVFRDRTDLPSGGELTARIQAALADSEALIVVCSPAAAQSLWVNREIETFIALHGATSIFPVIVAGEPESGDQATECLPPALRELGLLAADLRSFRTPDGRVVGDGRDSGVLKLIAGLLGVPLDALAQRERRRQRLLLSLAGCAAAIFAAVSVVAVWQSMNARENARLAKRNAEAAALAAVQSLAQQSVQAISQNDYVGAFGLAVRGVQAYPEHAGRFLGLMRWIAFASRGHVVHNHHVSTIVDESFSPDGRRVASVSADGVLLVSDTISGKTWTFSVPAGNSFVSVAVSNTHVAAVYMPAKLNYHPDGAPGDFIDGDAPRDNVDAVGAGSTVPEWAPVDEMPTTILVWKLDDSGAPPLKLASDVGLDIALEGEQNIALSPDGIYVAGCGRSANTVYSLASGEILWRATDAGSPTDWYAANCAFDASSTYLGAVTSGVKWLYAAATGEVLLEADWIAPTAGERVRNYLASIRFDVTAKPEDPLLETCGANTTYKPGVHDPIAYVYDTANAREWGDAGGYLVSDFDVDDETEENVAIKSEAALQHVDLGDGRLATRSPFNYLTISLAPEERESLCGRRFPSPNAFQSVHYATDKERKRMLALIAANNFPPPRLETLADASAWRYVEGSHSAVVADTKNRVLVYNVDTGKPQSLMQLVSAPIAFALSHDGKSLFVQTKHAAEFWDAEYGLFIARLPQVRCEGYCRSVGNFSPDDTSFSVGTSNMGGGEEFVYSAPGFAMDMMTLTDTLCRRLFGPGGAAGGRPEACPQIYPPVVVLAPA